ncbi:MAG: DNA polymerase III subunit alpha [Anaerolineales bacterium]|nr:DNA polymerase III subunit alpha [Anaerolineales bacterium]
MFVHLHTHSYYSFLDGVPSPRALAEAAARHGMPALALTDHHGLTGAIPFYTACKDLGVQPILGLELTVTHKWGNGNLILLAENLDGWRSLCRLSSSLQTAPHRDPERGLPLERLAQDPAGLICLTGGPRGLLAELLHRNQPQQAQHFLAQLAEIYAAPNQLYIELQNHRPADRFLIEALAQLARPHQIPLVATHNVHFLSPEQAPLQHLLTAMRKNVPVASLSPSSSAPETASFTSADDMAARFAVYPDAVANTLEIAARCQVDLPLGIPHYPELPLPPGKTALQVLRDRAERGAQKIYPTPPPDLQTRLDHELTIIGNRGYAPLFLIMSEILDYARREGVPTASRGSASSSLVAHCLGITTPDPLLHNLYFERFLNPARTSPPDIDTDLCSTRREKVLRHVYEQYGDDRVAMVATINRFRGRSALREVAKAYGLSSKDIKTLTDDVPYRGWNPRGQDEEIPYADLLARFPQHAALFRDATALQEFPRHLSVHPGGVVIAPGPLTDLVPLHLASKGLVVTQFDLDAIQQMGLVKIDLLGTRGLSVLGDVAEQIYSWNRREYRTPLAVLDAIPQNDPETAELVEATRTIGCFQIESPGMRTTLREVRARSPQDLLIALALYRPGPMTGGLKDAFIRRHLGQEKIQYLHPALAPLLADTYGVILYQEQVLRIASGLAGLSLADADLLRRAMSHFDPGEKMKTLKENFIRGALEKSRVPRETGEQIWELMAAFAGYGFPKAHAASYAQVAWQSAWCKAHYPAEFMAAVLANWGGFYSQRVYLNEARRMGLVVRPPHINHAGPEFKVAYPKGEPVLYMGLNQVRDLTRRTQARILQNRPFPTLEDFLTRVDPRPKEVENLIRVGGLSGLGTIPALLSRIQSGTWHHAQPFLFALEPDALPTDEWPLADRIHAQQEILGASVDAHLLQLLPPERLTALASTSIEDALETLEDPDPPDTIRLLGIRQTLQRFFTDGEIRYVLELEDMTGMLPVIISPDLHRRAQKDLNSRAPLLITGTMHLDPLWSEGVLVAQRIQAVRE